MIRAKKNIAGAQKRRRAAEQEDTREMRTPWQKVVIVVAFVIFLVYAVTLIFPFFYIVLNAFKGTAEFSSNFNGLPETWTFENFVFALQYRTPTTRYSILEMFLVSVMLSVGGTALTLLTSSMAAYIMAKFSFKGKEVIYSIVIFSLIVPIVGTLPATLQLLRSLGIYNTPVAVLFLNSGGFGMNFLLLYSFFKGLPWEYAEAAYIDGASDFQIFVRIMLPLAKGALSAIAIITLIGLWNDYTTPALFLPSMPSLAVGMQQIIEDLTGKHEYPLIFASVIIALIPVQTVYLCFSKTIMANTTVGGLKG